MSRKADINDMKINTNVTSAGVDGISLPKRPVSAPTPNSEEVSLNGLSSVTGQLQGTPDIRPEAVERARTLIANPNYPGTDEMSKVSQLLADNLGGAGRQF
jgi:hypothetical protein